MLRFSSPALALAALLASPVRAQDQTAEADRASARAHARQGLTLYGLGKYAEAMAELELAYQKKPVPALLFNIAQCNRQLGRFEEAARLYRMFLDSEPPARQAQQARELLAAVEEAHASQNRPVKPPPIESQEASSAPASISPAASSNLPAAGASWPAPQPAPAAASPAANAPWPAAQPAPEAALRPAPFPPGMEKAHLSWPWMTAGGVAVAALSAGAFEAVASRSATHQLAKLHRDALAVDAAADRSLRNDAAAKFSRAKTLYVVSALAAAAGAGLFFAF